MEERANYPGTSESAGEKAGRRNDFPSNELPRPTCFHGAILPVPRRGYRRHAVAKLCFKLKLYAVPFLGSYGAVILAKCLARMFRFTNLEQAATRHIRLRVQLRLLENHRLPFFLNFYSKNSLWISLPRDRRNWGWFRSQLFHYGEAISRSFLRLLP